MSYQILKWTIENLGLRTLSDIKQLFSFTNYCRLVSLGLD